VIDLFDFRIFVIFLSLFFSFLENRIDLMSQNVLKFTWQVLFQSQNYEEEMSEKSSHFKTRMSLKLMKNITFGQKKTFITLMMGL
jgi:hypothetical protein